MLLLSLLMLTGLSWFMLRQMEGKGFGAVFMTVGSFLIFVFFLFIFAKIISPIISGIVSDWIASNIVFPKISSEGAQLEYTDIEAMISRGELDEASSEIKAILLEKPEDEFAVRLMCSILADHRKDYVNAVGLLAGYLRKETRTSSDFFFVMRLSDIYLETGCAEKARELLSAESLKCHPPATLEKIRKRLDSIPG